MLRARWLFGRLWVPVAAAPVSGLNCPEPTSWTDVAPHLWHAVCPSEVDDMDREAHGGGGLSLSCVMEAALS